MGEMNVIPDSTNPSNASELALEVIACKVLHNVHWQSRKDLAGTSRRWRGSHLRVCHPQLEYCRGRSRGATDKLGETDLPPALLWRILAYLEVLDLHQLDQPGSLILQCLEPMMKKRRRRRKDCCSQRKVLRRTLTLALTTNDVVAKAEFGEETCRQSSTQAG